VIHDLNDFILSIFFDLELLIIQYRLYRYYVDMSTDCRGFHVCQADDRHDTFVCPANTLFNQQFLICDWPHKVNCQQSEVFFDVNMNVFVEGSNIQHMLKPNLQPHLRQNVRRVQDGVTNDHSLGEVVTKFVQKGINSLGLLEQTDSSKLFSSISHYPSW